MAGKEHVNNYIDKLEIWLNDSIFDKGRIQRVGQFTEEQQKLRSEKVRRIHELAKKVGEKRASKVFEGKKEEFRRRVGAEQVEIEEDPRQQALMKELLEMKGRMEEQSQRMKRLCVAQDY